VSRILITGCSTGIGRATALELAARGHEVIATARRPETLDGLEVAQRLALDVDSDASVAAAVTAAGEIDVLVNNAGWEVAGPVEKVGLDQVRAMFETNYFGAVRMIQAVVPQMRERGSGVVVNVSSVAGRVAGPLNGFYAGTKYALEALSESMHYELRHFGIRTVIVEPGAIVTKFQDNIRRVGVDDSPYDELFRLWHGATDRLTPEGVPGPDVVARIIADGIEDPGAPLRTPAGADAELVIATRGQTDDATFEATMRAALGLTW